ncbi:hypothetical protein AKO1_008002 [Acrasis kona]|uniref:Exocyst complex component Sec8 n=1 Tax=Acrasis kona TaxID=1008807 RepID=A0AAW2YQL9_9EUKA
MNDIDQLLVPALRLITAITCCLKNNKQVAEQVIGFVNKMKLEMIRILKDAQPFANQRSVMNERDDFENDDDDSDLKSKLEQARLVTSLFYLLSEHVDLMREKLRKCISNFESHMLQAMNYCCQDQESIMTNDQQGPSSSSNLSHGPSSSSSPSTFGQDLQDHKLHITRNVVGYCRNATNSLLLNQMVSPIILFQVTPLSGSSSSFHRVPSMDMLYSLIKYNLVVIQSNMEHRKATATKLLDVDRISPQAIQGILNRSSEFTSATNRGGNSAVLLQRLSSRLSELDRLISCRQTIIEGLLLVLWRHLNMYLQEGSLSDATADDDANFMLRNRELLTINERERLLVDSSPKLAQVLDMVSKMNKELIVPSEFLRYMVRELNEPLYKPQQQAKTSWNKSLPGDLQATRSAI